MRERFAKTSEQIQSSYPLAPTQAGMLFDRLLGERPGVHIEQIVCELNESVDRERLGRAWASVCRRHDVFRTAFRWAGIDRPMQDVYEHVEAEIRFDDWTAVPEGERHSRLHDFLDEDRLAGFALDCPPLFRLHLFRFAPQSYRLVWSFYHGILDGRSFPLVLEEVFGEYDAAAAGESYVPPERVPFRRFVEWLEQNGRRAEAAGFWRDRLRGFSVTTPILPALSPVAVPPGEAVYGEREIELDLAFARRLTEFAAENRVTPNTVFQGAWALLLSRLSGENDVVFGSVRACRGGTVAGAEDALGTFINTLPVRVAADPGAAVVPWLQLLRAEQIEARPFEHTPLAEVQQASEVGPGVPLFDSILIFDHSLLGPSLRERGGAWTRRDFTLIDQTNFPLTIRGHLFGAAPRLVLNARYYRDRFADTTIERLLASLGAVLRELATRPRARLGEICVLDNAQERLLLAEWNATDKPYPRDRCVHELFAEQVARTPLAPAIVFGDSTLSYRELELRASRLARRLRRLGVGRERLVGIALDRSADMVVAVLATMMAGGAYVPLDPAYPPERLRFMVEDSGLTVIVGDRDTRSLLPGAGAQVILVDEDESPCDERAAGAVGADVSSRDLAYVIYTSGSTGKPKGVAVEHRNVVNFFCGMDDRIAHEPGDVWLAVTSLSFDISVLELLWTLTRGLTVVIYADEIRAHADAARADGEQRPLDFSLFYFASDEGNANGAKYRLLLEGARFADTNGFEAVWTPERHFHAFGGLYPNPAVVGAAIAAITTRVRIRAGSVVMPLQDPLRVAEEWSVVDNISGGRVGISFASGWQPNDFVLAPENYDRRKEVLYRDVETVMKLWRGESLARQDGRGQTVDVSILPRPIQERLPVWITAAGAPETFREAGERGMNVLTHLLGQSIEELAEKLAIYRDAWRRRQHPGDGHVTLMLHTLVGEDRDAVRELVREPMKSYLRSAISLVKKAAWHWPTTARTVSGDLDEAFESLSPEEKDALVEHAFQRYFETSGLFGTPESCSSLVEELRRLRVDEIACLIDFGVDAELVLAHLPHLARLRRMALTAPGRTSRARSATVAELIEAHGVTHLQCTPSLANVLALDARNEPTLAKLKQIMIGGEAFPPGLAARLKTISGAAITNMYGPTETTVWSATYDVRRTNDDLTVPIGRPIANTRLYVVDRELNPLPIGAAGELLIGGEGVVRGYLGRPELTAERFVDDPFCAHDGSRLYRTGDLARFLPDGNIEFLGRLDHQVKVRGHRIELGEIEAVLGEHPGIREVVVVAREDAPGDKRLVAYLVATGAEIAADELREALRSRLPEYMFPSHFVYLASLPLTPNGKVDRKSLPAPHALGSTQEKSFEPPGSEVEERIAAIWRDVLHVDQVGRHDNFFDIGGNSLHVVQVHSRLRSELGQEVSMTDLFRFPTVRALARSLGGGSAQQAPAEAGLQRADARRRAAGRRRQPGARGADPVAKERER